MRRATPALLSTAAVLALLASCGTDRGAEPTTATGRTTASQKPSPAAPTTPAEDPAKAGPPFADDTAPQTAKNSGQWDLVFTDIRVGEHNGFDRIVLEFTGTGSPGWAVNYVDKAALDGSGEVVPLGGGAFLDIYASGTTYPDPDGNYYSGPRQFEPPEGRIDDVYVAGTFEGYTQVLVGIDGDRVPFRVFALAGPSRLVVDVVDSDD